MRYTIRAGRGDYGGLRVVHDDPEAALQVARDMVERGLSDVRVLDQAGETVEVPDFSRRVAGHGLTTEQIDLIQQTCDVLISANSPAADIFYDRLFALAPETRAMFAADLTGQKRKLLETLVGLVGQITHPGMFVKLVAGLGGRHAAYGVRPEHYGPVGQALLDSLAFLLGERFTPAVREAWTALYGDVAAAMQAAAEPQPVRG